MSWQIRVINNLPPPAWQPDDAQVEHKQHGRHNSRRPPGRRLQRHRGRGRFGHAHRRSSFVTSDSELHVC